MTSQNYVLKTATGGTMAMVRKVVAQANLETYIADSADCVSEEFVNFDLEISRSSCLEMLKGRDEFSPFETTPQQHSFKTGVPARISRKSS